MSNLIRAYQACLFLVLARVSAYRNVKYVELHKLFCEPACFYLFKLLAKFSLSYTFTQGTPVVVHGPIALFLFCLLDSDRIFFLPRFYKFL